MAKKGAANAPKGEAAKKAERTKTPSGSRKHTSSAASAAAAAAAAAEKQRRRRPARPEGANPVWFKPLMFGFLAIGFLWIIVYYLSSGRFPIAELGSWNILVGFGIAFVGFLMTTNWKS
ncbi:cell division protein CrgA [Pseudoclavibacter endophyticus]|uniref:Cell division protein CrgA n=1 Tax=Pseudoclavibacter endophyticus TaxID=1778590 RepID=A0A6H9WMK3_9MICO|nr:cell division protein CrgA [Pseudoclavibacter endophyticus]